jgi:uncharacterized RDD family membrane protein YckC
MATITAPLPMRVLASGTDALLAVGFIYVVSIFWFNPMEEVERNLLSIGALAAFGVLLAFLLPGRSPGKLLVGLFIADRLIGSLSTTKQILRHLVRISVSFVLCWSFALASPASLDASFAFGVITLALIETATIATTATRSSIADLIVGSIVIREPPPQTHRAPAGPMYSATDNEFGPAPKIRKK